MKTYTFDRVRGLTVMIDENWQDEIIDEMLKRKRKCVIIRDSEDKSSWPDGDMYVLKLEKVTDGKKEK